MASKKAELIFDTPGVLQRVTQPHPYRLIYEDEVVYKHYDGDDEEFSGLMVDDRLLLVPRDELKIDKEAKTIEFDSRENGYIIRPISEEDKEFFSESRLERVQNNDN